MQLLLLMGRTEWRELKLPDNHNATAIIGGDTS